MRNTEFGFEDTPKLHKTARPNSAPLDLETMGPLELCLRDAGFMVTAGLDMNSILFRTYLFSRYQRNLNTAKMTEVFNLATKKVEQEKQVKDIRKILADRGYSIYFSIKMSGITAIKNNPEDPTMPIAIVDAGGSLSTEMFPVDVIGEETEVNEVIELFREVLDHRDMMIRLVSYDDATDKMVDTHIALKKTPDDIYYPQAYPWLGCGVKEYFQKFMESDENVLIIYGPPGTGKSSWLRHGLLETRQYATLSYSSQLLKRESTIQEFMGWEGDMLIYEDCDDFLIRREDGNSLMATILNSSQGIVRRNNKKLIFSTNLPNTSKIDPALLREGRCFDILHFRNLTVNEGMNLREAMGLPVIDFGNVESVSLAQATRRISEVQVAENRHAKRAGF